MGSIKGLLEWYLGIDPARPGEGSTWTLESAWPGSDWFSREVAGGLCLFAVALIWWVYRRDAALLSRRRRWGLTALRLASFALLLIMLSRLTLQVEKTGLPNLAVLIDVSGSMGLVDHYGDPKLKSAASRLARDVGASEVSRLAISQGLLAGDEAGLLKALAQRYRLQVTTFAKESRPLVNQPVEPLTMGDTSSTDLASGAQGVDDERGVASLSRGIRGLVAEGLESRPGAAAIEVLNDFRGGSLAGMVVFTDGVATTTAQDLLSTAARMAQSLGVPFYIVGVGSEDPARDVEVDDVRTAPTAFLGDPVTVQFRLRAYGFARREVEVTLREEGNLEAIATTRIILGSDGVSQSGELTYVPESEGVKSLIVESVAFADEVNEANNRGSRKMEVQRKQLRVLLVERLPRWEYRALKPVLERDDAIALDTLLLDADLEFAPEDRTSLRQFPATLDQLAAYDVVIWGDIDLNAIDTWVPQMLKDYVSEKRGGLILIAGSEFNPISYASTPLETLLPVLLENDVERSAVALDGVLRFQIERTIEGKSWPFMHLAETPASDTGAWNSLPAEFDWLADTPRKKPGAQVLAVHPTRQGVHGKAPVIVVQRYGRGHVLYHATDELWKWRRRVEDLYYGRYWSQAIRAMARSRQDTSDTATLTADRSLYELSESVRLRLQLPAAIAGEEQNEAEVTLSSGPGDQRRVVLRRLPGPALIFEGTIDGLSLGAYRVVESDPAVGAEPGACEFRVVQPQRELADRQMNRADLNEAARLSHGRFLTIEEAGGLLEVLPTGRPDRLAESRPIPLWKRWEVLLLLTILLAAEWIFRKQSRLV